MAYVSARYGPPSVPPMPPGSPRQVIAVDDEGVEWSLREDSEVGDWLRFVAEGGTIEPFVEGTPR